MSRHSIVALVALTLLAIVPAAGAAPPPTGEPAPARAVPTQIEQGFVGPVFVGPRSYCAPMSMGGLCADVVRRGCVLWRRSTSDGTGWARGRILWNDSPEAFWTGPYAPGYHWVWGLGTGYGVVARTCLYHFEPQFG